MVIQKRFRKSNLIDRPNEKKGYTRCTLPTDRQGKKGYRESSQKNKKKKPQQSNWLILINRQTGEHEWHRIVIKDKKPRNSRFPHTVGNVGQTDVYYEL